MLSIASALEKTKKTRHRVFVEVVTTSTEINGRKLYVNDKLTFHDIDRYIYFYMIVKYLFHFSLSLNVNTNYNYF